VALSPSIPTSFVPKQPVSTDNRHYSSGGNNVLLIVASIILGITLVIAAGTFIYSKYLTGAESAKAAQVLAAQQSISQDKVDQFIRLRDRLTASKTLINQHVALTQFFNLLETISVQNVHFDGVDIVVADDRSATIAMTGEALNFNALAAQSNVFASQKYIKSAIFTGISVNKDSSVSFSLTANLDPALVIETVPPSQQTASTFIASPSVPATQATATSP
jgi:hypothetical protein